MKSCAVVPARLLSKVITTVPASPVTASSRSLLVSSVSLNWGEFGLKKLRVRLERYRQRGPAMRARHLQRRGDDGTVAEVDAVEITHRNHRSLGIAAAGVVSRITIKPGAILGNSSTEVGWRRTVTWAAQ